MVLILRKHDHKLISCSRKKFIVYEHIYTLPLSLSSSQLEERLNPINVGNDKEGNDVSAQAELASTTKDKPTHVQSIKSVSAHTVPPPNTTGLNNFRVPTTLDEAAETQSAKSGEGVVVPEHAEYSSDLQNGISLMKKRAEAEIADPGIRQKVIFSP